MRRKQYFFNRITNFSILITIVFIIFFKSIFYFLIINQFIDFGLGGGNDSGYYDDYAVGRVDVAVNIWPVILRLLNNYGLYSRDIISYVLFFISLIIIPIISCRLTGLKFKGYQKYYLYCFLVCSMYPTIYFYSTDVYRDVFMVFSFLIGCIIVKGCLESVNSLRFYSLFILAIVFSFFLLALRPYLGYAFLISLFLWKIKFTKKRIIILGSLYFLVLFLANYIGAFDVLTEYRSVFEELDGGSNLGLDFSNPLMFIPNILLSLIGQMFGLYITNPLAIIILIIETLPFLFMLVYVMKNIKLADSFIRFLIVFFVLYASVWLIGNDNLGTAVRLRIYNYLAIYISFFYILRLKNLSTKKL